MNEKLTKVERLILMNQYEILSRLEPDQAKHHELTIKRLSNGYLHQLHNWEDWIADPLPDAVHSTVYDVLTVCSLVKRAHEEAFGEGAELPVGARFVGFDGNNEVEHFGYARHLLFDEGIFEDVKPDHGCNSHFPVLDRYLSMVKAWKDAGQPMQLDKDQYDAILAAAKRS